MSRGASSATTRLLGLACALLVFILDQGLKLGVERLLADPGGVMGSMHLLPVFDLTWTENHGVSMGFFTADTETQRWALVAMTAAIALFVAIWLWREKAMEDAAALGLVLGGALGNILDRVRLGYVIDYADLHIGGWRPFLIFNLADAAITIGVLLLLARALLLRQKPQLKESH